MCPVVNMKGEKTGKTFLKPCKCIAVEHKKETQRKSLYI